VFIRSVLVAQPWRGELVSNAAGGGRMGALDDARISADAGSSSGRQALDERRRRTHSCTPPAVFRFAVQG